MQTTDTGLIFQSSDQLESAAAHERKLEAARNVGRPITCSSKVLAMTLVGADAYTAESGWQARRVDLATGKTTKLYKGHKGPVTSVAVVRVDGLVLLCTGSWDKTIRLWNADTAELLHVLEGHTDFVKSLTVLPSQLLLSTSSDRACRLWNLRGKPTCTQIIKEHSRPVECAAWRVDEKGDVVAWTGDSLGAVKEWSVVDSRLNWLRDLPQHETSILDVVAAEDGVWTASMDRTARFSPNMGSSTSLTHTAYVKAVHPLPGSSNVLTGSTDEDIRVWDISDEPRLVSTVPGHCGEVTAIASWVCEGQVEVVTASLDGTIRRWSMEDLLHPQPLVWQPAATETHMTEDEERELAELLSDDD